MNVINELNLINSEIEKVTTLLNELMNKRLIWAKDNRQAIKNIYPKKTKVYRLKDISCISWLIEKLELTDESVFFRPKDIRFSPTRDFDTFGYSKAPTVLGDLLDCNLSVIYTARRLEITNLIEDSVSVNLGKKATQIYLMIDKNTGFYKIGRSKAPKRREKTLQSEKPTIEMIFSIDGFNRDEKELHEKFKDKRIRGEWFDLNGSDIVKIKEYFQEQ